MPAIELPKAAEGWNKVKPLTLTQTGLAEQLRKLQSYRRPTQAAEIGAAKRVLNEVLAVVQNEQRSTHVERNEKAARWLRELAEELARENSALNILDGRLRTAADQQRREEESRRKLEALKAIWLEKLRGLERVFEDIEQRAARVHDDARELANQARAGAFDAQRHERLVRELTAVQSERRDAKARANWEALPQQLREARVDELLRLFEGLARIDERVREESNGVEARIRELLRAAMGA